MTCISVRRCEIEVFAEEETYDHAQSDLLAVVLLLDRLVQHDVQEDLEGVSN